MRARSREDTQGNLARPAAGTAVGCCASRPRPTTIGETQPQEAYVIALPTNLRRPHRRGLQNDNTVVM